jgi:hypothetical protein
VIERNVAKAATVLMGEEKGCTKCHAIAASGHDVAKPAIPGIWLTHARFDHSSHRAIGCKECHPAADPAYKNPPPEGASTKSADVMIPKIAVCQNCHAPRQPAGVTVSGGASHACTECHRYHNGDASLEGRGARARDAEVELGLIQFLRGEPRSDDTVGR